MARFAPGMETRPSDHACAPRIMRATFEARYPRRKAVKTQYARDERLRLSQIHVSVARGPAPGRFAACVRNGLGAARGTLTGVAAAEMAAGEPGAIARVFGDEPRPTRLILLQASSRTRFRRARNGARGRSDGMDGRDRAGEDGGRRRPGGAIRPASAPSPPSSSPPGA